MPIEAQQVGDKNIMEATRVEHQPSSGRVRFCTKLPSGKEINSEWIQESNKTKGVLLWCEAVRQRIVEEDQEERAKTRRRLKEEADARAAEPASTGISPLDMSRMTGAGLPTGSGSHAGLASLSDPSAFLAAALKQAEIDEQHWRGAALSAVANWEKAKADLAKWRSISSSLSPPPAAATPSPTSSGPTSPSGDGSMSGPAPVPSVGRIDFSDMEEEQE